MLVCVYKHVLYLQENFNTEVLLIWHGTPHVEFGKAQNYDKGPKLSF